ncbi:DUF6886 family protein [Streptomyces sp. SID13031]|uniref:DUF6886 family protein n=1 Tax=Streptomyces sp. SID13031 TaxID=2706046 RepID=UPI0013CC09CF|nr:DUF6886 family protein [Streptomyces sp. SID13031]NEA31619.1 hypothetical protein [Streptomyces sp. SID13031]
MRPEPGQVLHFSEDPTIRIFHPQLVPASARVDSPTTPYVWAVGHDRAPDYWFPRQCPRAMAWVGPGTSSEDRSRIIGDGCGTRVHAVEYGWLQAMRTVELYAYRLPAEPFQPAEAALVATEAVEPLGPPERVGDLLELHAEAGIQLRVLPRLHEFWDVVIGSTLEFSGIRLRNAIAG